MKVFISWSGDFSQKIAILVKDWLEQCIQSVEAFVSKEDIEKGENWSVRVNNELSNTNYGIVCLTKDNITAPWIHFEAGALSKLVEARVSTIAIDVPYSEIKGPLSSFQNTTLEKEDMLKLLKSVNEAISKNEEKALTDERLNESFNAFWPKFEEKKNKLFEEHQKEPTKKINSKVSVQQENIEELLQLARNQNVILSDPTRLLPPTYLTDILRKLRMSSRHDIEFEDSILMFLEKTTLIYKHTIAENFEFHPSQSLDDFIDTVVDFINSIPALHGRFYTKIRYYKDELFAIHSMAKQHRIRRIREDPQ